MRRKLIPLKKEIDSQRKLEKLNRELTVKVEEMHVLNRILSDFSVISSSSEVFKRLVDLAVEITRSDLAYFFIVSDSVRKPFVGGSRLPARRRVARPKTAAGRDRIQARFSRFQRLRCNRI
ncbi:MAG: hypothetical protein U5R30_00350 [Deltaproteobacteria bacterium]|nr:hypothetical protein [Deltaproteobacteria bacterium]